LAVDAPAAGARRPCASSALAAIPQPRRLRPEGGPPTGKPPIQAATPQLARLERNFRSYAFYVRALYLRHVR
jgi:hypothetical protein